MSENKVKQEKILFSVKEAAYALGVNVNTVYALVKKGYLPAIKLGSLKIRKTALTEFAKQYEGMDMSDLDNIVKLEYEE